MLSGFNQDLLIKADGLILAMDDRQLQPNGQIIDKKKSSGAATSIDKLWTNIHRREQLIDHKPLLAELSHFKSSQRRDHLGVRSDINAESLAEAGWGVIFPNRIDPAIVEALKPLLTLRQQQAGDNYKIYQGEENGYRQGDSKLDFLYRHGVSPNPANPKQVPYYLLIVGGPEIIPYSFQYHLDIQYAVGRIHFLRPEDYANYAKAVIASERRKKIPDPTISFFAPNDDRMTELSTDHFIKPISDYLKDKHSSWQYRHYAGKNANKTNLSHVLGGDQTPTLLLSASHGLEVPYVGNNFDKQQRLQGAIVCHTEDNEQVINESTYFSANDIVSSHDMNNLIHFCFACYGAGTPKHDQFPNYDQQLIPISKQPFVAQLPMTLLSQKNNAALAFIGHIERAWTYSFRWPGLEAHNIAYQSALDTLLKGAPIGHAMEYFNHRYTELNIEFYRMLEEEKYGKKIDKRWLNALWIAANDARNHTIIGDPAIRLFANKSLLKKSKQIHINTKDDITDQSSTDHQDKTLLSDKKALPQDPFDVPCCGLIEDTVDSLQTTIEVCWQQVTEMIRNSKSTEIRTYHSKDPETLLEKLKQSRSVGSESSAKKPEYITIIDESGDITNILVKEQTSIDSIWKKHQENIKIAYDNRLLLLRTLERLLRSIGKNR